MNHWPYEGIYFCHISSLTSSFTKGRRDFPMGVGIFRKSMMGFENLLTHNNFRPSKPSIDFLEMPTPMEESLCLLMRLDVKAF